MTCITPMLNTKNITRIVQILEEERQQNFSPQKKHLGKKTKIPTF